MGYYTYYDLAFSEFGSTKTIDEIHDWLVKRNIIGYALSDDFGSLDAVTWYDHEEDMEELSLEFPEVIFTLHGEGDNKEDIWEKHFLGGLMQTCYAEIIIPDFDMLKLKPIRRRSLTPSSPQKEDLPMADLI